MTKYGIPPEQFKQYYRKILETDAKYIRLTRIYTTVHFLFIVGTVTSMTGVRINGKKTWI